MKRNVIRFALYLLPCVVGVLLLAPPVRADSSIIVTTTSDRIADDSLCSLREAIIAANTDNAFGDCLAGSGADRIVFDPALPAPTIFTLTLAGRDENSALTGDLDISGTTTISSFTPITIDGNATDRVFEIHKNAKVNLIGVTIRNGNPGEGQAGGGVFVDLVAHLVVTNSQIISNSAQSGGGAMVLGRLTMRDSAVSGNQGGGLNNAGGLLALHNVQIINNCGGYGIQQNQGALNFTLGLIGSNQGGGIYNAAATATLTRVNIIGNTNGGGAVNTGASLTRLTIDHSQILSNTATTGGGVLNEGTGASIDIYATRISGNHATSNGGGLFNRGIMSVQDSTLDHNQARAGAGLHHLGGNLSLRNDTFSQNSASDNGGGLYNGSSAVLNAVTFTENRAAGEGGNIFNDEAQLSIENSIVAHAQDGDNCVKRGGFLTSLGHNLESAHSCNFSAAGDMVNADPLLGPLQDNGGPTVTHALLSGSPAIDQGAATCPATDQRGVTRPQGIACDIGAYEFATIADLAVTARVAPATVTVGTRVTYTLGISNLGPAAATTLALTDELPHGVTFVTATIPGGVCAGGGVLACTLPALAAGAQTTATIVVRAPLTAGLITNTAVITAATLDLDMGNNRVTTVIAVTGSGADVIAPGPVGNLTATTITSQGATLSWTPATDNVAVAGYRVFAQKNVSGQSLFLVGQVDASATTYTVTTLAPDTAYQLWVIAYDLAGNTTTLAASISVSITTLSPLVGVVEISLEPPLPTVQDAISLTVSGRHTSSCTPQYQAHQRTGYVITIQSVPSPEPFCLPAEFPWHYTIGLGLLDAGRYTVTHTLEAQVDTTFFTVTSAAPDAPLLQVDEGQTHAATVGELFQFIVKATGTPAPTYTLLQAPPGMTIDPISGQLTWTPNAAGTVTALVLAANNRGSATYTLQLSVQLPATGPYSTFLPLIVQG